MCILEFFFSHFQIYSNPLHCNYLELHDYIPGERKYQEWNVFWCLDKRLHVHTVPHSSAVNEETPHAPNSRDESHRQHAEGRTRDSEAVHTDKKGHEARQHAAFNVHVRC